ncbi:MAG: TMAO reductase system periplasmic protein TorT [Thermomicrobiales bacterium]|nr:TMAO reductase system periplasmic protein TorT [Thermomicrobiales bacterium]
MSHRSRAMGVAGASLALTFALSALMGAAGPSVLAQEGTPVSGVGTEADLTAEPWTWPVDYVVDGKKQRAMYQPIDPAQITQPWNICVAFPHLKDPYWLGANFGIAEEIRRDGVKMQLFEAGGYTELDKQLSQMDDCVAQGAQAIILGAISAEGSNAKVEEIVAKGIPVIDFVNGVSSPDVSAHARVSFYDMGRTAGQYMVDNLVSGDEPVSVAFFPGPQGAGWTDTAYQGFLDATEGTPITVVDTKWGDTGRDIQLRLIEDELQANPDIDFIVGNAQASVSAVQAVREAGLEDQIKILAFHQNPPVYDGIAAGDILAASNDHTVIQGRIAVDQAVRLLEGQTLEPSNDVGPVITVMTPENLKTEFVWESTFAPKDYKPEFTID